MTAEVAAAYSESASAWQAGPGRIYDRLADVVVSHCPIPLAGCRVLDHGAGTGAAGRAVASAGAATVIAVDAAFGMLAHERRTRPPAVAGDALALPFAADVFDVVIAAFSLNHLVDPAAGLRELVRTVRRRGAIVAAVYAADDAHPVKVATEEAMVSFGWRPPSWYAEVRESAMPTLASAEGCRSAFVAAGLDPHVDALRVAFSGLGATELIEWRLGMAQHAPFLASLPRAERAALAAAARTRLGTGWPPLERSILVASALV